jgi:hypothetical protein
MMPPYPPVPPGRQVPVDTGDEESVMEHERDRERAERQTEELREAASEEGRAEDASERPGPEPSESELREETERVRGEVADAASELRDRIGMGEDQDLKERLRSLRWQPPPMAVAATAVAAGLIAMSIVRRVRRRRNRHRMTMPKLASRRPKKR